MNGTQWQASEEPPSEVKLADAIFDYLTYIGLPRATAVVMTKEIVALTHRYPDAEAVA